MSATRRDDPSDYDELEPVEAEELDTLEPIDDDDDLEALDELEPVEDDDSPVTVSYARVDEAETDLRVDVEVPDMPKPEVAESVRGPLGRFVTAQAAELRWQRVRVVFGGDALIGTAVKELVAETLKPARPAKVVVIRGYGEETVHEETPPAIAVDIAADPVDASRIRVAVRGDDLEGADLAAALRDRLEALVADADGKALEFEFPVVAPRALRAELGSRLGDGGARRLTIDGKLIFDRELESRVQVASDGDEATVDVTPADDDAVTRAAFDMVMPTAGEAISGRKVTVRFHGREPRAAEIGDLLERVRGVGATGVALAGVGGLAVDVLWPEVLKTVKKDDRTGLRVVPDDRDGPALLAALRREIASLGADLAGQRVQVDWPKGFAVDGELERAVVEDCIVPHAPKEVAFSFAGQDREPVWPAPVAFREEHDGYGPIQVVDLDLDAGKPVEVLRAAARRVAARQGSLRDQRMRVAVRGETPVSGSLLRGIDDVFGAPAPRWLEVDFDGKRDVLRPVLIEVGQTDDGIRVTADPSGRQPEQVALALERELAAVDLPAAGTVHVTPSAAADAVIVAAVASGAERVVLDGAEPVQVHPRLFADPVRDDDTLRLAASGDGDEAAAGAQAEHEVARLLEDAGDLSGTTVELVWDGGSDAERVAVARALHAIRRSSPARIVLDGGDGLPLQVEPPIDDSLVEVVGRRDAAEPRLLMIAIVRREAPVFARATVDQVEAMRAELEGARVLVVHRDDAGEEIDVPDEAVQTAAVLQALRSIAAAVLARRSDGPDGQPCFEVLASQVPGLKRRARTRDPRLAKPEPEPEQQPEGAARDRSPAETEGGDAAVEPFPIDEDRVVDPAGVPDAAPPIDGDDDGVDALEPMADDDDLPTLDAEPDDDEPRRGDA